MNIGGLSGVMGAILIVAGIIQIFYQMKIVADFECAQQLVRSEGHPPGFAPGPSQEADFGVAKWSFRTAYPGILMIIVGALLLGLGNFVGHSSN
jgi:hypothetical protein